MQKYLDFHFNNEKKALVHYKENILVSESFYSILSVFEVALRNCLHYELSRHYATPDWYLHVVSTPGMKQINKDVNIAQVHINKRNETVTASKVVAELTLGFWVMLLNAEYEMILWKSLRKAFPCLPKKERQRHKVSVALNNIRNFRNRVYHNEPVAWSFDALESIHEEIIEVLGWLNAELPEYARSISRFHAVLDQTKIELGL